MNRFMHDYIYHWIEKIASGISVWCWHKRVKILEKERIKNAR